jgi:tyrosine-protein kinase
MTTSGTPPSMKPTEDTAPGEVVFCTACGRGMNPASRFCRRCGEPREGNARTNDVGGIGRPVAVGDILTGARAAIPFRNLEQTLDPTRLVATVRAWWWLILACGIASAVAAYGVSQALPKEYDAEARVLVGSLTQADYDQQLAYQQLAQTYVGVATTTPVLNRVAAKLGLTEDVRHLAGRIDVRAPLGQSVLRVVAKASTPSEAADLANAIAAEIITLGKPAAGGSSVAEVVEPGAPPDSPSSPRLALNTAVAGTVGLALGLGVVYLLAGRKPRLAAVSEQERVVAVR